MERMPICQPVQQPLGPEACPDAGRLVTLRAPSQERPWGHQSARHRPDTDTSVPVRPEPLRLHEDPSCLRASDRWSLRGSGRSRGHPWRRPPLQMVHRGLLAAEAKQCRLDRWESPVGGIHPKGPSCFHIWSKQM